MPFMDQGRTPPYHKHTSRPSNVMVSAAATDHGLRTTDECSVPSSTAEIPHGAAPRARHYVQRTAYLGTLWIVGLTAYQTMIGWTHPATLGETARFGAVLFQLLTGLMLALFLFFSAPVGRQRRGPREGPAHASSSC